MNTILIKTQKAFAACRSQGHQRYNVALKNQAVSCLAYYNYKQVGDVLSITGKTIRNWEKALNRSNQGFTQEPKFIPISLSPATSCTQSVSALSTLQLTLPSGLMIGVPHQNIKEAIEFIIKLNKELSSCSI